MKRAIAMVLMAALLAFSLCGCGASGFDGLYSYIEDNGSSGEDGKRVEITVENDVRFNVYFEAVNTGKIILGYYQNGKATNVDATLKLKIYLDGKSRPYFEVSSETTLTVDGVSATMEESSTGHVNSASGQQTLNIETYSLKFMNESSNNELSEATKKSFDLALQRIWNNLPQLIEETGVNVSMEDLGLAG